MNHITDSTLWALGVVEAHENEDAAGIAAMLEGVEPEAAIDGLAGLAAGLILALCMQLNMNPRDWLANIRAQALLGELG